MQMRNSPDFFVALAVELTQSVGSVTCAITSFAVRLPSSSFRPGFRAKGTFLGGETTGCTVGSVCIDALHMGNIPHHSWRFLCIHQSGQLCFRVQWLGAHFLCSRWPGPYVGMHSLPIRASNPLWQLQIEPIIFSRWHGSPSLLCIRPVESSMTCPTYTVSLWTVSLQRQGRDRLRWGLQRHHSQAGVSQFTSNAHFGEKQSLRMIIFTIDTVDRRDTIDDFVFRIRLLKAYSVHTSFFCFTADCEMISTSTAAAFPTHPQGTILSSFRVAVSMSLTPDFENEITNILYLKFEQTKTFNRLWWH